MTKPEYVETDKFILFLDEGISVNGNIIELIDKLMLMAEKETGFTLTNNTGYEPMMNDGPGSANSGPNPKLN